MDTKKHYKLYKDGKKWCVMTIAAVASVIGLATTANADDTDTTTSPVQTAQVADNSNVVELPQSNAESVQTISNPASQNIENENSNSSVIPDDKSATPVQPQSAQEKTGWVNENNNWTYYNNGQVTNGRDYTYLPTINGEGHSWYLVDNGVVQSGVQQWAGSYYDFDANNNYQRVDNNYVQSQWGDWYLFGNDGRVLSGLQKWFGSYYYFDPTTFLKVTNQWRNNQYFGADGIRYQNQFLNDRGRLYRFDANGNMLTNRWFNDDGAKKSYYFGADGVAYTGRHVINGVTYVFNNDGVRIETIK